MLSTIIGRHFITVFLIFGFSMKLIMHRHARDARLHYLWMTTACVAALVLVDSVESWAALDPERRSWRTLFSVAGYILRPAAGLGMSLVVARRKRQRLLLYIPAALNALLVCTAFFSPVAFSFNENYEFVRGPLGFVSFALGFFYIAATLCFVWKWFEEGRKWEGRVLVACALFTAMASIVDSQLGDTHLNEAIMISVIFYYIFIRSRDTDRDALTKLLNRQSFYEDSETWQPYVTAVASIDMNGLKHLNDREGHGAGDKALADIGQCLLEISGKNTLAYRMGGDEFVVLFLRRQEADVTAALDRVRTAVTEKGLSISMGYAFRREKEDIDTLYQLSDQQMYEDKSAYYRKPGNNRRARKD